MRKVLFVGGPRHGETIEADGYAIKLPMERWDEAVILPIEKLSDDQFIARWPEGVEWRPPKFKVGDRVRTLSGSTATIHAVYSDKRRYTLQYADGSIGGLFGEDSLSPAPTLEDVIFKVGDPLCSPGYNPGRIMAKKMAKAIREAFPEAGL